MKRMIPLEELKRIAYDRGYNVGLAKRPRDNVFAKHEKECYIAWNKGYNDGVKDAKAK